jgi:hypothetical protein
VKSTSVVWTLTDASAAEGIVGAVIDSETIEDDDVVPVFGTDSVVFGASTGAEDATFSGERKLTTSSARRLAYPAMLLAL